MLCRSETGKKNKGSYVVETIVETPRKPSEPFPIQGGRYLDLEHMCKQMFCTSCKKELLFHNIQSEDQKGLGSYFFVKCDNCDAPLQRI